MNITKMIDVMSKAHQGFPIEQSPNGELYIPIKEPTWNWEKYYYRVRDMKNQIQKALDLGATIEYRSPLTTNWTLFYRGVDSIKDNLIYRIYDNEYSIDDYITLHEFINARRAGKTIEKLTSTEWVIVPEDEKLDVNTHYRIKQDVIDTEPKVDLIDQIKEEASDLGLKTKEELHQMDQGDVIDYLIDKLNLCCSK